MLSYSIIASAGAYLASAGKVKESRKVFTNDAGEKHVLVSEYSGKGIVHRHIEDYVEEEVENVNDVEVAEVETKEPVFRFEAFNENMTV